MQLQTVEDSPDIAGVSFGIVAFGGLRGKAIGPRLHRDHAMSPGEVSDLVLPPFFGAVGFFSSTRISSNGRSLRFSGRWLPAASDTTCPAVPDCSVAFPPGKPNFTWRSVRNTATPAGCQCITDFSCGPSLMRSTRT